MSKDKSLSENKVKACFKMFDQDGNGFITREELETIMGGA